MGGFTPDIFKPSLDHGLSLLDFFLLHPLVVLSSESDAVAQTFAVQYGQQPTHVIYKAEEQSGLVEPRAVNPARIATWKASNPFGVLKRRSGDHMAAIGTDVNFFFDKTIRHKPSAPGTLHEPLIQEAMDWYSEGPFVAHWLVSMALRTTTGLNRASLLHIKADFPEPLPERVVRESYDPRINARVPLVELGEKKAQFSLAAYPHLSEKFKPDEHRFINMSFELAYQLIIGKLLPPYLFLAMLNAEKYDRQGFFHNRQWGLFSQTLLRQLAAEDVAPYIEVDDRAPQPWQQTGLLYQRTPVFELFP